MKVFYQEILELEMTYEDSKLFTVKIGSTHLTFMQSELASDPFYHFAINIPENKIGEAKNWLKHKVELNIEEGEDEVFFTSWNAHAIYFEDPSGNILELIARHNLNNKTEDNFSSKELLNISEVGVAVDDVIPFVRKLNKIGIPNWRDDSEGLTPVGDENGLIITVKNGRRWFFSNKDAKFFPVIISIEGLGIVRFEKRNHFILVD